MYVFNLFVFISNCVFEDNLLIILFFVNGRMILINCVENVNIV